MDEAARATARAFRLELGGWGGWNGWNSRNCWGGAWGPAEYVPARIWRAARGPRIIACGAPVPLAGADARALLRAFPGAAVEAVEPDAAAARALAAALAGARGRPLVVRGDVAAHLARLRAAQEAPAPEPAPEPAPARGPAPALVFFPALPAAELVAAALQAAPLVVVRATAAAAPAAAAALQKMGAEVSQYPARGSWLLFARGGLTSAACGA